MKLLLITSFLLVLITGCQKDNSTTTVTPKPTKLQILTDKQWFYSEIYYNATAPRVGTLIYKRGASSNIENRDLSRALFWQDGTFDQIDGPGNHTQMQWVFSNSDSTQYKMIWSPNPDGNTNVKIIQLTEDTFEWFNPDQKLAGLMFSKK